MSRLHAWVERIWWQDSPPPLWLRLIEPIYAAINRRNLEKRAAHSISPARPLISVGNITAGGSGKTPFVIWLAGALKEAGRQPVILCRGDGGKATAPVQVGIDADPAEVGDEAVLLAQQSGCPVIAARDRVQAAALAAHLGDLMILDDGFQYRQLKRACDIVLIPGEGVGNGHQLPAGPLREPVSALQRADIVVRSGKPHAEPLGSAREWHWQTVAGPLTDVMHRGVEAPASVFAACGIARPERFFHDLEDAGLTLLGKRVFADHHRYSSHDVAALIGTGHPVAVTGKDAVKLARLWPQDQPLWVLPQRGSAESGLLECIQAMLH